MRNMFILILSFTYLTVSSGIDFQASYCWDGMVSKISGKDGAGCKGCKADNSNGMLPKGSGCCTIEHKLIKLTTDHQPPIQPEQKTFGGQNYIGLQSAFINTGIISRRVNFSSYNPSSPPKYTVPQ